MVYRLLLALTVLSFLTAAVSACDDIAPDPKFTCEQQAQWKKCNEPWMKDKCNKSCKRCQGDPKPADPKLPAPPSPQVSVGIRTTPINPKATAEAKKLYTALLGQYGKKILSGQQQSDKNEIEYIRQNSGGKEPVIKGYDFIDVLHFGDWSKQKAYIQSAIDWSKKKGGVVTFCWHWRNPSAVRDSSRTHGFMIDATDINDAVNVDLNQLSNKNSNEYKAIIRDIGHVAKYLRQAQSAKVPIFFRSLHEAQGGEKPWFWWGAQGPEKTKELYRLLYSRLVHRHRLNNLLWVWTTNSDQKALSWYPGPDLVDFLGMDLYAENKGKDPHDTQLVEYNTAKELFKNTKMIAMTENGGIPDPAKLATDGANWSWFCTWTGPKLQNETLNAKPFIETSFNHERVLTLGQFKI